MAKAPERAESINAGNFAFGELLVLRGSRYLISRAQGSQTMSVMELGTDSRIMIYHMSAPCGIVESLGVLPSAGNHGQLKPDDYRNHDVIQLDPVVPWYGLLLHKPYPLPVPSYWYFRSPRK